MERKLFFGHYLIWVVLLLEQMYGYKSCISSERKALLELKKYIISKSHYLEVDHVPSNLTTWNNDTKSDCCQWKGVECNGSSRRVIGLFVADLYFNERPFLNLSLLHPFEELRSLKLSAKRYSQYYSFNGFFDDVEGYKSLRRLKHLETLDLSDNAFENNIFPFLNAASSLTTLFLGGNDFNGSLPVKELSHLKKLKALDLSSNHFSGSMEFQELKSLTNLELLNLKANRLNGSISELMNLTKLELLSLAYNSFSGPIAVVCEMKNLRELDLRENHFVGQLPLCLGSLKKLVFLDLSSNQLSGNLPSTLSSLESLKYLSLLDLNFTCLLSLNPLANLTKLKVLKLSSTSDMIQVEAESTWLPKFHQLSVVVLRFCKLEKIHSFLVYQKNLRLVDLSSNKLSGNIPTWLLANNSELEVLQLQNNSFTLLQMPTIVHNNLQFLDFSANGITGMFPDDIGRLLPSLVYMDVSNNGFQGRFPSSMSEMKNISFLDMSYNNFSGKLLKSFLTACSFLEYLKLSHNRFSGIFLSRGTNFTSLKELKIDNNLMTGKIGVGLLNSPWLKSLDMSNNLITGAIPSWISRFSDLRFLLLSNNLLKGFVPSSLVNSSLSFLDLSRNLLSGHLLSNYGGSSIVLLNNNKFTGPIPETLLEGVEILDLQNNKLSGSIPQFVNFNSEDVQILLLRGNNLTGFIPRQLCDLRNIRLLDLSNNKFNGFIPSCLSNLSFGQGRQEYFGRYSLYFVTENIYLVYYKSTFTVEAFITYITDFPKVEIKFATKQRYDSYSSKESLVTNPNSLYLPVLKRGILDYMSGMDLSNNELSGVIPAKLGNLMKLQALNLSHNFLTSYIPSSFSNLTDIESLDLSHNMLHGSIPQQLTSLTSLEVFDVSYNNLSGMIPQGRQFNTFNEKNYLGNPFLCGPRINISCEGKKNSEEVTIGREEENESAIDMVVFYYSTASGFVTALIGIIVLMCFDFPWRRQWLRIVDALIASAKSMLS